MPSDLYVQTWASFVLVQMCDNSVALQDVLVLLITWHLVVLNSVGELTKGIILLYGNAHLHAAQGVQDQLKSVLLELYGHRAYS